MKKHLVKTREKIKEIPLKSNWSKSKKNKILLGSFLLVILITIIIKTIVTILWDTGYYEGKFHLWYWHSDEVNDILKESKWCVLDFPNNVSDRAKEFAHRALVHPYFFWSLTQFTWQTTFLLTFILCFRLFMYDDRVPKWLRWTHSQRTLSIVTMYDIIVCIVFWSAIAKNFGDINDSTDGILTIIIHISTILVHAVIPACMVIYSLIYLLLSTEASRLNRKFLFLGIIYPTCYIIFYLLISIIWMDPYPVSDLATTHDFSQIWIAFMGLIGIFVGMAIMMYIHNTILFKFNKKYRYEYDYEVASDIEQKLEKLEWKVEKSKRKIELSVNDAVIKKEKIALAKREIAVMKAEYAIKKHRTRAQRYEKEYIKTSKNKAIANSTKVQAKKTTPKNTGGKKKPSTPKNTRKK